jgi:hypothetical protein
VVTEEFCLLGCNTIQSGDGRICCLLHAGFCLAYFSTRKMEVICSSNMFDFHWPTWCYIPEDRILQFTDLFLYPPCHVVLK